MDVVGPILDLPESLAKLVLLVLAIGFPVALIMAWAFEMTPGGLVRDGANNAPRYAPGQRRKIDYFIFGTLLVALDGFETAFEARDNSLFSTPVRETGGANEALTRLRPEPVPVCFQRLLRDTLPVLPHANDRDAAIDVQFIPLQLHLGLVNLVFYRIPDRTL